MGRNWLSWMLLLSLSVAGCGGGGPKDKPKLVPAAGVARFKGQPVKNAAINFYPEKGPVASGLTDESGAFTIKYNGQLGAVIGKNKVTVISTEQAGEIPEASGDEMKYAVQNTFSKKYNDPATTDLIVDLPEAGNTELVLDLTP
jgi:predicted small lipoprotein YifL